MLVMPFKVRAAPKLLELSSNLQPVMFIALELVLVSSNQSAATGELPLLQGATSVTKMPPVVVAGVSFTTSVTAKVYAVVTSGVLPIVVSSTLTFTL
jgi:hypothetical protein